MPPLRRARILPNMCSLLHYFYSYIRTRSMIAVILSSVPLTLLLLRNSLIPLHQSSNFVQSPSNHPGSGTMFFGNPAWMFSLATTAPGAGVPDISVSIGSYLSVEASSLICRDPSHSDNASILSVLLELILSSRSLYYTCFVP